MEQFTDFEIREIVEFLMLKLSGKTEYQIEVPKVASKITIRLPMQNFTIRFQNEDVVLDHNGETFAKMRNEKFSRALSLLFTRIEAYGLPYIETKAI